MTSSSLSRSWIIPSSSSASNPLSFVSLVTVSLVVRSTTASTDEWEISSILENKLLFCKNSFDNKPFILPLINIEAKSCTGMINNYFHRNMRNSLQHSQHLNLIHSESWDTLLNQENKNCTKEEILTITHLLHKKVKRKL